MKKILSLLAVLGLMTACGGDEDEALVSDPDFVAGAVSDQTLYYVGGDSAFVYESPEPLRFVSSIACVDSCLSQTTHFRYDEQNRLNQVDVVQSVNGQQSRRQTVFRYTPSRISYETTYGTDSAQTVRRDRGYVVLDKEGLAVSGVRNQLKKDRWAEIDPSVFNLQQVSRLQRDSREDEWIECVTDYKYRYSQENDLLKVDKFSRLGRREYSNSYDMTWNVGNLALVTHTHADCSYLYGDVPNKTNLDLNCYFNYAFTETTCSTDALFGLLGVYGNRSARLCAEFSDGGCVFSMHYDLDDEGYVTRIDAERLLQEDVYNVNARSASQAWERMDTASGPSAAAADSPDTLSLDTAASHAAPKAKPQHRTFTVTYL